MREDLTMLQTMTNKGWEPVYSYADKRYKRFYTKEFPDVPNDQISFKKGNLMAWSLIERSSLLKYWCVGDMIENHITNHRYYESLKDVLENEPIPEDKKNKCIVCGANVYDEKYFMLKSCLEQLSKKCKTCFNQ